MTPNMPRAPNACPQQAAGDLQARACSAGSSYIRALPWSSTITTACGPIFRTCSCSPGGSGEPSARAPSGRNAVSPSSVSASTGAHLRHCRIFMAGLYVELNHDPLSSLWLRFPADSGGGSTMRAQDKQAEKSRLKQAAREGVPWKKWGPYLSERQWGGVRENVDRNVEAWDDVTHDQARSRAYISGEDGIAGWCDEKMLLCFALGLWNGKDPILKERMFGLTNGQGNHGEDVKEYYFYADSTPTHAYASMLYKYPQAAFPYEDLVAENGRRSRKDFEYELMDTGVFDEDRYWDV